MSKQKKGRAAGFVMSDESKLKQRKSMAINYRTKKNICVRCGKALHEGWCDENYEKNDYRSTKDKAPKSKLSTEELTITDNSLELKDSVTMNDSFDSKITEFDTEKAKIDVELKIAKKFILIDISPPQTGEKFNADFINFYAKQYKEYITVLTGNISFYDGFFKTVGIEQEINVSSALLHANKKDMIAHLNACKLFISFHSEYVKYCASNEINCIYFKGEKNPHIEGPTIHEIEIDSFNEIDLRIFQDNAQDLLFDI